MFKKEWYPKIEQIKAIAHSAKKKKHAHRFITGKRSVMGLISFLKCFF